MEFIVHFISAGPSQIPMDFLIHFADGMHDSPKKDEDIGKK